MDTSSDKTGTHSSEDDHSQQATVPATSPLLDEHGQVAAEAKSGGEAEAMEVDKEEEGKKTGIVSVHPEDEIDWDDE